MYVNLLTSILYIEKCWWRICPKKTPKKHKKNSNIQKTLCILPFNLNNFCIYICVEMKKDATTKNENNDKDDLLVIIIE